MIHKPLRVLVENAYKIKCYACETMSVRRAELRVNLNGGSQANAKEKQRKKTIPNDKKE